MAENPIAATGQAYVSNMISWITDRLKEKANIQKQSIGCSRRSSIRRIRRQEKMMSQANAGRRSRERVDPNQVAEPMAPRRLEILCTWQLVGLLHTTSCPQFFVRHGVRQTLTW